MAEAPLLTAQQEVELGTLVQQLVKWEAVRVHLEERIGRPPAVEEWAMAVNPSMPTDEFQKRLAECRHAKSSMIHSNMRLVASVAKKYSRLGVSTQDLIQEGAVGLIRAIEKFDPTRGFRFATYATWWIQQSVFRAVAFHSRMIRLPMHMHNLLNKVRLARRAHVIKTGVQPTEQELADQLDVPLSKLRLALRSSQRISSSSAPVRMAKRGSGFEVGGTTLEDLDLDPGASGVSVDRNPEQVVETLMFREELRDVLQVLEEEERFVLRLRYGLGIPRRVPVSEIAKMTYQSTKWVKRTEAKALRKLRRPYQQLRLSPYSTSVATLSRAMQAQQALLDSRAASDEANGGDAGASFPPDMPLT